MKRVWRATGPLSHGGPAHDRIDQYVACDVPDHATTDSVYSPLSVERHGVRAETVPVGSRLTGTGEVLPPVEIPQRLWDRLEAQRALEARIGDAIPEL